MADLFLTWADVDAMADQLAERLRGKHFDYFLGIARGGFTLTHLLSLRLGQRNLLSASVQYYEGKQRMEQPLLLHFPPEVLLHGKRILVIDEVWQTGQTIALIRKIIARAGGEAEVVTLHFKPSKSEVGGCPDYYIAETEEWVHYPWEPRM